MLDYITPRAHTLVNGEGCVYPVLASKIISEPKQVFSLEQASEAHHALESRPPPA